MKDQIQNINTTEVGTRIRWKNLLGKIVARSGGAVVFCTPHGTSFSVGLHQFEENTRELTDSEAERLKEWEADAEAKGILYSGGWGDEPPEEPDSPQAEDSPPATCSASDLIAYLAYLVGGWNASPPHGWGRCADEFDAADPEATARYFLKHHEKSVRRPLEAEITRLKARLYDLEHNDHTPS